MRQASPLGRLTPEPSFAEQSSRDPSAGSALPICSSSEPAHPEQQEQPWEIFAWIDVVAVPKARPRFSTAPRRSGQRQQRAFTPKKTKDFERIVSARLRTEMAGQPLMEGPVIMTVNEYRAMPKSWSKRKRAEMAGQFCATKPDTDNVAKAVKDAANGVVFHDDAQVAFLKSTKRWAEIPRLIIKIERAAQ